ncbi:MAG: hypothetical protein AAF711_16850 [Planctomycetota bacterium]
MTLHNARRLTFCLAMGVVLYWALGLAYAIKRTEPYPAIMMPDFKTNGGLEGTRFGFDHRVLVLTTTDGRTIRTSLIDTLTRNGFSRGQAVVLDFQIAHKHRNEDGTYEIQDRLGRVWGVALRGISPDGPIPANQVDELLLILERGEINVASKQDRKPVYKLLAETVILPEDSP